MCVCVVRSGIVCVLFKAVDCSFSAELAELDQRYEKTIKPRLEMPAGKKLKRSSDHGDDGVCLVCVLWVLCVVCGLCVRACVCVLCLLCVV